MCWAPFCSALPGAARLSTLPAVIAITIENEGRLRPHYHYGPTTIRVGPPSPNRRLVSTPNRTFYEVTITEGPKYPRPKHRSFVFACKFNPHRTAFGHGVCPCSPTDGIMKNEMLQDGALVVERSKLMAAAARAHPGAMSAVLGLDGASVAVAIADIDDVWVANDNAPGQVVVSVARPQRQIVNLIDVWRNRALDSSRERSNQMLVVGVREANGETRLTGPVVDQAALHGLLKKVRDLGLPLISVNQVK